MKKLLLNSVLLSTILLGASITTHAEEVKNDEKYAETDISVDIKKDNGYDQNKPGVFVNNLGIVHKPTAFKYSGIISANQDELQLKNLHEKKDEQVITVNDDRKDDKTKEYASTSSWQLKGKLSPLVDDKGKPLDSQLEFKTGTVQQYNIGTTIVNDNGTDNFAPENPVLDSPAADANYTLTANAVLPAGGSEVTIMTAKEVAMTSKTSENRGAMTKLGDNTLRVKKGGAAASYTGKIIWTLSDTL